MIGRKAEAILNLAVRYAVDREHEYFTLEHVLWALLGEDQVKDTLRACEANIEDLRRDLESYLDTEVPKMPEQSEASDPQESAADEQDGETNAHPVATLSIQRLIQRALFQVQSSGKDEIQPIDLFVALFQAKESYALQLLTDQGVERLDVLHFVSHGIKREEAETHAENDQHEQGDPSHDASETSTRHTKRESIRKKIGDDPLELYTLNLNQHARLGKVDPLIGRQAELDRMIQILCRRRKNNPILVGEAGVGKTAIAEGLALRIIEGAVPSLLEEAVVYSLDLGALLAGAKFRGDFEQRLKSVLQALEKKGTSGTHPGVVPILMIDEIHTIIGAGAVSGGALDAANLLKPMLTRGELRVIGSTTYSEYRSVFEKDHALARRFQKIDVNEPTVEESVLILNGLKSRFEDHHEVEFTPEAIRAAVELAAKHLTDRFLPDKAIDVIDEAGAKARLSKPGGGAKSEAGKRQKIEKAFVEEIIAQIARIPARSVNVSQKERLKNLDRDLKLSIYGQDHAVEALVTSIRLARSGLRTGERPVGSFLFCGPTGVGKTELSKQLALCQGIAFLRFDMSEYSEKHTISRLIVAPPGYVGYEQAGLLTDAVMKNPHSVILLDEIEKAHSEIWNILLQIMDHGTLTDNNGRKADFRNTILIMTSNVGSRELERRPLGMSAPEHGGGNGKNSGATKAVEQTFSPEFRNRLDSIVYFNPLDPVTVGQVVGKQVLELESQLLAKKVEIDIGMEVRDWLAQKGYDRTMGARPLARLIQDQIKKPLAEEILFGKLENGGRVEVVIKNGEIAFIFKKALAPKRESEPALKGNHRD
jgi:ATP-dependent Clp protease ATP-binding subunit ClpA